MTEEFTRDLPFAPDPDGDGLTLTGYAAVFNERARIQSVGGEFDEIIRPGAFTRSLEQQTPALMFDHGKHPMVGNIPIGTFTAIREDDHGVHVTARLHDNYLTQPVRDAIAGGSINGMSFRFLGGDDTVDKWTRTKGGVPQREILSTKVLEMGPVVFPAYTGTEVAVRNSEERQVDPDENPVELAEALDAVIDAASAALDAGDTEQASNLLDAAEVTSDALLMLLGGADPDDAASPGGANSQNLIGQSATRSSDGNDNTTKRARHRALLLEGIIHE